MHWWLNSCVFVVIFLPISIFNWLLLFCDHPLLESASKFQDKRANFDPNQRTIVLHFYIAHGIHIWIGLTLGSQIDLFWILVTCFFLHASHYFILSGKSCRLEPIIVEEMKIQGFRTLSKVKNFASCRIVPSQFKSKEFVFAYSTCSFPV